MNIVDIIAVTPFFIDMFPSLEVIELFFYLVG